MCQMSVVVDKEGTEELLFEDVTNLVVEDRGLQISTLFEGPKSVERVAIDSIDFMAGKVFLKQI
jgi:predicted RNA-binding protein